MHDSVKGWAWGKLAQLNLRNILVLDVGSLNVNGTLRPHVVEGGPKGYIGIDMQAGPGVDIQMSIQDTDEVFMPGAFDLIICTEMLEHAAAWADDLVAMVELLKDDGALILTTRSPGFPYHGFPHDYWRFTVPAMAEIMSILELETLEVCPDPDPQSPGVFAFARNSRYVPIRNVDRVVTMLLNVDGVEPVEQP